MFVGHIIVSNIELRHDCVWYVDRRISRKYGNNSYQYMDIYNDIFNIKTIYDP